jgi:hypothetical protein
MAYAIGTDVIRRLYPIDPMTIGGYMMVLKYYQEASSIPY